MNLGLLPRSILSQLTSVDFFGVITIMSKCATGNMIASLGGRGARLKLPTTKVTWQFSFLWDTNHRPALNQEESAVGCVFL